MQALKCCENSRRVAAVRSVIAVLQSAIVRSLGDSSDLMHSATHSSTMVHDGWSCNQGDTVLYGTHMYCVLMGCPRAKKRDPDHRVGALARAIQYQ